MVLASARGGRARAHVRALFLAMTSGYRERKREFIFSVYQSVSQSVSRLVRFFLFSWTRKHPINRIVGARENSNELTFARHNNRTLARAREPFFLIFFFFFFSPSESNTNFNSHTHTTLIIMETFRTKKIIVECFLFRTGTNV